MTGKLLEMNIESNIFSTDLSGKRCQVFQLVHFDYELTLSRGNSN